LEIPNWKWNKFSNHLTSLLTVLHKKFTWPDFGGIYTDMPPIATPLRRNLLLVPYFPTWHFMYCHMEFS